MSTVVESAPSASVKKTGRSSNKGGVTVRAPASDTVKVKPDGEIDVKPPKSARSSTKSGSTAAPAAAPADAKADAKAEAKAAKQQAKAAKEAKKEAEPCKKLSSCPAFVLFLIFSVIVLIFQVFSAWNCSPQSGSSGKAQAKYWTIVVASLLVTLALIFAFGWWIKSECNKCEGGRAWFILLLAIFLPIVLGFIFSVIVGALQGGASFITRWLSKKPGDGGQQPDPNCPEEVAKAAAKKAEADKKANAGKKNEKTDKDAKKAKETPKPDARKADQVDVDDEKTIEMDVENAINQLNDA